MRPLTKITFDPASITSSQSPPWASAMAAAVAATNANRPSTCFEKPCSKIAKAMERADNETSKYYADIARGLLDRALHSDQFWWASRRPMWDINLINRGLMEQTEVLLNAYKALKTSGASDEEKAECYYREIAARDLRAKIRDHLFRE